MKRRANGEGTYFKRPNGRWVAQTYVTQTDGSRKRVSATGKSREIVRLKLTEILEREAHGLPYFDKDWTVGEYLDYWMDEVQADRLSETSMLSYRMMIRIHIKPTLGSRRLKGLMVHDVRLALREIKKRGASGRTQQKYRQILSACLNYAMSDQLISCNAAQMTEKPAYEPEKTAIWSVEQAKLFLREIKEHPHYIAFLLFLTYGMRRAEVLGLRWQDIDFENGYIYVRQQIDRVDGRIMARKLKTKNSYRRLPLSPKIREALTEHAKRLDVAPGQFNSSFELSPQGTVVISSVGTPLEPRNLNRCFNTLLKKAGLPRIKIHAMRHTAATILKDISIPDRDIQLILGHSNSATTINIYQHGTPAIQEAAISAAEDTLLG